jgi:nucleoid-associated protein YgaU
MFVLRPRLSLIVMTLLVLCVLYAARPGSGAGSEERYVVRTGDTLWSIAEARYGGDPRQAVWRIERRNDLGDGPLAPGDVLMLPP